MSAPRHERATRRVLWLMAQAGYIGRDVARLGSEPPPEPVAADEEPPAAPETEATPESTPPPAPEASPEATPGPAPTEPLRRLHRPP